MFRKKIRQLGSSGTNKVEGPQVSPHILPLQPSAPMDFILLGVSFPPFLKKANQMQIPKQNWTANSFLLNINFKNKFCSGK